MAAGAPAETLTGLSPLTTYTYTAYSDSGCSTALTPTASFTTPGVSVSNLGETEETFISVGDQGDNTQVAAGFTTGANGNGYHLNSVTVRINSISGSVTDLSMAIHADSSGYPASQATHT